MTTCCTRPARRPRSAIVTHGSTVSISRALAYERRGTAHTDLYESLKVLFLKLRTGYEPLGIPGMGSFLFSDDSTPDLDDANMANQDLLDAFRSLCYTDDTSARGGGIRRPVDFGNLGSEELGSVYESLLELHPLIDTDEGPFTLDTAAGHERKTTGSYYTPTSLINCLLDSALDPVVHEAINVPDAAEAERKLLDLKVCDPACGSGHFLIAAADRMATHLARIRTGDDQPNTIDIQHAKRDIIGRCIYGVDMNPMAVELCKVSLWMEALEPGKPLSFLDHHIQCGNSLIGATPKLLADGIPDDAFKAIEGDDKEVCKELKKRNKREREDYKNRQGYLFEPIFKLGNLVGEFAKLADAEDDSLDSIAAKREKYAELVKGTNYQNACLWADTSLAAFLWKKEESDLGWLCPTERKFRDIERNPVNINPSVRCEIERLRNEHRVFHWHLAFPDVFSVADTNNGDRAEQTLAGGFDVVLGNPPWELVAADQGQMAEDAFARQQYLFRVNDYEVLSGRRDLYKLFLVQGPNLIGENGVLAFLTPFGFYVENESAEFRSSLFDAGSVLELRHFQNHGKLFFDNVHASYRFCQIVYSRSAKHDHCFTCTAMSPTEIPNAAEFSVPRAAFDAQLGKSRSAVVFPNEKYGRIHQHISNHLSRISRPDFNVVAEFHASTDKKLISTEETTEYNWAILKNRNIHQYDYLFAPAEAWVSDASVRERMERKHLKDGWFDSLPRLVFRDIARNDDERTLIACLAPPGLLSSYDTPMIVPASDKESEIAEELAFYAAAFNAFVSDFLIRPFVDKHIKGYVLNRVPWPDISRVTDYCPLDLSGVNRRISEYVGGDSKLLSFLKLLGYDGPSFNDDSQRRFEIRCELDAGFFHLYLGSADEWAADNPTLLEMFLTPRHAVDYIMDTFPIVRRKDEAKYDGEYRTKTTILKIYDEMAEVMRANDAVRAANPDKTDAELQSQFTTYQSPLNPPPGPPSDAQGNFIPFADWTDDIRDAYKDVIHLDSAGDASVTRKQTATPAPATSVTGIAASAGGSFPATATQRLLVGLTADLVNRSSGVAETTLRELRYLASKPDLIAKLIASENRKSELNAAVAELPSEFLQLDDSVAPWSKVLQTLRASDAIESVEAGKSTIIAAGESCGEVIAHFGTLPESYMQFVELAIKAYQSDAMEELDQSDAEAFQQARTQWTAETNG